MFQFKGMQRAAQSVLAKLLPLFSALAFLVFCLAAPSQTQAPIDAVQVGKHIDLPAEPSRFNINHRFFVSVDAAGSKTIADMPRAEFQPVKGAFAAGYTKNTYWLKFSASDRLQRAREWWLELEPPFIDQVDFYEEMPDGSFRHAVAGDTRPASLREVANQGFVFQMSPRAEPTTYYIRLQSSGPIFIKAQIWHSAIFVGEVVSFAHYQAASYGALLLLIFLILVQAVVLKESIYLAFMAHAVVVLVTLSSAILPLHLPDGWYMFMDALLPVSTCLSVSAYALFCRYFIAEQRYSGVYRWIYYMLIAAGLLGALLCINPGMRHVLAYVLIFKIIGTLLPVIVISRKLARGSWYERLVFLGILAYVPAQAILYWRLTNVFATESSWVTIHAYTSVILLHMLLMTFALAERMRSMASSRLQLAEKLQTQQLLKKLADKTAVDQRSFLSMLSHELRGPLSSIRTATHNLRQLTAPHTDQAAARLLRIDQGLQLMASLIAVCLEHERDGFAQPLSLDVQMTRQELRDRLESDLSPQVLERVRWLDQSQQPDVPIKVNPALLTIAVRNLVENASRYDTSAKPVEIDWQAQDDGLGQRPTWRICVLDRGPGMPEGRLAQMFEPFVKGQPADADGLGLGLYIVKRIASMHGAVVQVRARQGGGSIFEIERPFESDADALQPH